MYTAPTPYTERSDSFNSVASSQTNGHMPNDGIYNHPYVRVQDKLMCYLVTIYVYLCAPV